MRKKVSLALVGLLAGATISVGSASPAYAQGCTAHDPTLAYVCRVLGEEPPDPTYYYNLVGAAVKMAYCTLWEDPACG